MKKLLLLCLAPALLLASCNKSQARQFKGAAEGNEYRVRVFRSSGTAIYSEPSKSESIFVPLENHDVYLLSTGKDILKFKF